jgi:hypothetical protein
MAGIIAFIVEGQLVVGLVINPPILPLDVKIFLLVLKSLFVGSKW